jgi:hypothetical protein
MFIKDSAFRILDSRFRIFERPMSHELDTVDVNVLYVYAVHM